MMDDALAQADAFFDPAKQHSSGARRPLGHSVTATRAARAVRGAALLAGAAAGGMAAVAGWALLLSLLAARTLAPPAASLARPLYFDYTATPAVAEATFLGEGVAAAAAAAAAIAARKGVAPPASPRAFPPGRRVDVWLAVEAPEDGRPADVFQVRADLLGVDGRVLATASRPALVPPRSRAARALRGALLAPLVVLGLADDLQVLSCLRLCWGWWSASRPPRWAPLVVEGKWACTLSEPANPPTAAPPLPEDAAHSPVLQLPRPG